MSKTKFHVKISGLEISFEGEREDLPKLNQTVGSQVQSLIQTPTALLERATTTSPNSGVVIDAPIPSNGSKRKSGSKAARTSNGASATRTTNEDPVAWKHDVERWGAPLQSWNPTKKAIWLLFVAKNEAGIGEMTPGQIANTFNQYFKECGSIRASNVSRDLRKTSQERPPMVQKNNAAGGQPWYLTNHGLQQSGAYVKEARGISDGE